MTETLFKRMKLISCMPYKKYTCIEQKAKKANMTIYSMRTLNGFLFRGNVLVS